MSTEPTLEGFDAISEKLHNLYPEQNGSYYGTMIPYFLGGNDPLDGVEVWKSENGGANWHYVTYGFTELYEKESEEEAESGYGFELTFRLKRGEEAEPPTWPVNLLQNLARYVFSSGNVFGAGHHMSCNGPIALETTTKLTALGFRVDPELGEMDTCNGHMVFLQAIALTEDEMNGLMCWSGTKFLDTLTRYIPMGITDLNRDSVMGNSGFRSEWEQGVEQDGSSTGFLYMDELKGSLHDNRGWLRLGAGHVKTLTIMLRARLGKGRDLYIQNAEQSVYFRLGAEAACSMERDMFIIQLTAEALEELCAALQPHAGEYSLSMAPLTVVLVPTHIKDQEGNVLETIG